MAKASGDTLRPAALLNALGRHHPPVDGNKRTFSTLMVLLLSLNGYCHYFDMTPRSA